MRLLLSGGGDSEYIIPLDELFVSQINLQGTVLYIPVAMEASCFSYEQCFEWFRSTYFPYGIENIEMCTDLSLIQNLNKYTAIFIGGGNTFKLLNQIKRNNFGVKLIDYLNNGGFVYGGSAGAIIFGDTIKSALHNDDNNVGLLDLSALGLAGGKDIWCHYSATDSEYIKDYNNDLYILYEESGLYIQDSKIESVGKMYLTKTDII